MACYLPLHLGLIQWLSLLEQLCVRDYGYDCECCHRTPRHRNQTSLYHLSALILLHRPLVLFLPCHC